MVVVGVAKFCRRVKKILSGAIAILRRLFKYDTYSKYQ
ncbi:MAG TPA: hypothetical protein [Caudoviricetes sp.]|nr:MAG TPA: hypothetical protein [Caudoviricetes sp.]